MRSAQEDQLISFSMQHRALRVEPSRLLLNRSCSFFDTQWHWGGWWGGDAFACRTTWPPMGDQDTQTLSLSHTLVIVSLSVYWQQIVWKFLSLPPPTIEWVNMLYSALTYKTAYAMMCNRLLHVPTNWSLLRGLFETLTYRLHSKFCLRS